MAPISPDNTQRFWVDYETCSTNHTLMCRAGSTVLAADAGATMAAFLAAFGSAIHLLTVSGFRSAAPGTNISVPETWPGAATYGSGVGPVYKGAYYADFVGRGSTGHRVRAAVFGLNNPVGVDNFRYLASEATWVQDCLDALTSDGDIFLDIDYEVPVWKSYANSGGNAYWRNKIR
jgi:hypothetical protein